MATNIDDFSRHGRGAVPRFLSAYGLAMPFNLSLRRGIPMVLSLVKLGTKQTFHVGAWNDSTTTTTAEPQGIFSSMSTTERMFANEP